MTDLLTRSEEASGREQGTAGQPRPSLEPPIPFPRWKALIVGASPPPYHGSIMMFAALMQSSLRERFRLIHLDISDHRDLDNIGRFDLENVRLGIRHAVECGRLLRREQPELVYVPVAMTPLGYLRDSLFLLLARVVPTYSRRPRRVVVHAHGGHFGEFYRTAPAPLRAYIRRTLKGVDAAVVHTDCLRPMFAGLVPEERIWSVPNGIEGIPERLLAARSDAQEREAPLCGQRPPTVLYLGNLVESKGFLDVMAAAPLVARSVPGVRFIVAGAYFQPGDREQAERMMQDPEIRAVVQLPGVVKGDTRFELMRDADLFVFPTYYPIEGQPTVLLEAMSAGLPVVTTDQGAIRDTIVDGETGYLVPKRDPEAIARRVVELLQDRSLRVTMGAAGRRRFEERFRVEQYGRGMAAVFEAALRGQGRRISSFRQGE
jgi:glycosyltransferase involved in cell wall biosynthesis